jgi:hypothetical protein
METKFIEVTNGPQNWGKFMVGRFTVEEGRRGSRIDKSPSLLLTVGWTPRHILVVDLQTGEGSIFQPGGYAPADLDKHKIWVCPMFEPFLTWLYKQDLKDLNALPSHVDLPDAPFAMSGYRRKGKE